MAMEKITMQEFCKLVGKTEEEIKNGDLDLRDTAITQLPEGLTVGESIDLEGTGITQLPEGLTVGGYLDLENCTGITQLPEGLTVGGDLYLRDASITHAKYNKKLPTDFFTFIWEYKGRQFIKCDGIFSQIIEKKGNVFKTKYIGKDKIQYIVTDGSGRYAHGDSIHEAKEDLLYKISNRDTSRYENLTPESNLTFEESIQCYRIITGACAAGTKDFVTRHLKQQKESYTIAEIGTLTRGHFGNEDFRKFFHLP